MDDPVRVTLETDEDAQSTLEYDDEGAVTLDGVTVRYDLSGLRPADESDAADADEGTDDAASEALDADGSAAGDGADGRDADGDHADAPSSTPVRIAPLDDVPSRTTTRFEALSGRRGVEGILQRQGDDVIAWENSCPHEPEVRLDKGMGAFVADGQIICDNHGARFNEDDGFCTHGPCRGRSLAPIDVEVRDGAVYLTDDRFDDCRRPGR
jgi:nitrite reductase/ring-hydroxylating ferredoxin subunit